ncbi:MAG: hypothetical protein NC548_32270 [Lachnospiraceae bacterium]|nr:hypothetical protein [Lachnospiraceae bacterium]
MDLDLAYSDLVFEQGDFRIAPVPKAMPLVLGVTTFAGSWAINTAIGTDLTGFKQNMKLYDLRLALLAYTDCVVKAVTVQGRRALAQIEVEGGSVDVSL